MKTLPALLCVLAAGATGHGAVAAEPILVIHGGAGVVAKDITPERERDVRATLERALKAGHAILDGGGTTAFGPYCASHSQQLARIGSLRRPSYCLIGAPE